METSRWESAGVFAGTTGISLSLPVFAFVLANDHSLHLSLLSAIRVAFLFFLLPSALGFLLGLLFPARRGGLHRFWIAAACWSLLAQASANGGWGVDRLGAYAQVLLSAGTFVFFFVAVGRLGRALEGVAAWLGAISLALAAGFCLYLGSRNPVSLRLPFPDALAPASRPAPEPGAGAALVVIFDGLPLEMLLDEAGEISAATPAMARLAREGRWIPESTTNSDETLRSIPILLSGRIDRDHRNLGDAGTIADLASRSRALEVYGVALGYRDVFGARAERALDDRDYFDAAPELLFEILLRAYFWRALPRALQRPLAEDDFRAFMKRSSLHLSEEFFDSLARAPLDGRFYLLHLFHPHPPFVVSREGRLVRRAPEEEAFYHARVPEDLARSRAAAAEEIRFVDAVVGRIRATLERRNAWDSATVVITSDHGLAWTWETRKYGTEHGIDTMTHQLARVPFFLKTPGPAAPLRNDYQHLDLLPTLADVLGFAPPDGLAGRSVRDTAPRDLPRRVVTKQGSVWRLEKGRWKRE